MIKGKLFFGLWLVLLSAGVGNVFASTPTSIEITKAWASASFPMAKAGAAYVSIKNISTEPLILLSASTSDKIASKVEIHETKLEGDVAKMHHQKNGVTIEPNQVLKMKPKGLHIMLMGLKKPLTEGEVIDLSLTFSNGEKVELAVPIKDMRVKKHHHKH